MRQMLLSAEMVWTWIDFVVYWIIGMITVWKINTNRLKLMTIMQNKGCIFLCLFLFFSNTGIWSLGWGLPRMQWQQGLWLRYLIIIYASCLFLWGKYFFPSDVAQFSGYPRKYWLRNVSFSWSDLALFIFFW